jgi:hypothetical protein
VAAPAMPMAALAGAPSGTDCVAPTDGAGIVVVGWWRSVGRVVCPPWRSGAHVNYGICYHPLVLVVDSGLRSCESRRGSWQKR